MNNEISGDLNIKEDILELKEEVKRLNNLIINIIEEFKLNSEIKKQSEDSREIDEILEKIFNNS